ncbi:energy transducer TonB [Rhodohalobacter sp. SW132]|uniref:energy transducer TonB n=1 Tax=Rhodohalobacter sp. SW132 TaxID=2293433 RepID=UPI000E25F443|nr:energy transducer TonB [Rhodohalobacter sp. SW132]REL38777.1 energy transducer TonB [Rhodohalobacter sp. SW132]
MKKETKNNEIRFTNQRRPEVDLRRYYTIFLQIGLILSLAILIGLTKITIKPSGQQDIVFHEQEIIEMEEIIQTRQQERVPPPPRPPVPVAVPNDVIIDDVEIMIDSELNLFSDGHLPPPPPPQREDADEPEEDFFVFVEDMPQLKGGVSALQQEVRYPELAARANIQGRVIVQFIINEKGEVENPQVIRGIGGGCDEEALRVIRNAQFTPGMQRGRPVRVQYTMPITFTLR